ncbi:MAG: hypothetical protein AAGF33_00495 [Pseudomonadota bacterium]
MEQISFISLADGKTASIEPSAISFEELGLYQTVIDERGADLPEFGLSLTIVHPEHRGERLDGAIMAKVSDAETGDIVSASIVCWDPKISDHAWAAANKMQMSTDVFLHSNSMEKPLTPWTAGITTQKYLSIPETARALLGQVDRSISQASLHI